MSPLDDGGEAAQAFERYDLVSAPVVDASGRLVGRLTIDEVVDVIREEGEEAALAQAGLREDEDIFASVWNSAKNRWLWLAVNLCTAFFASRVIDTFEGTIEKVVALAALMPIVAGIAGNSGNQTLTLLVRSLALGQVTSGNQRRLMLKEIGIAVLNGAVWGGLAGLLAWLLYRDTPNGVLLGLVMFLAMILNMLVAAAVGLAGANGAARVRSRSGDRRLSAADLHHRLRRVLHLSRAGDAVLPIAVLVYATRYACRTCTRTVRFAPSVNRLRPISRLRSGAGRAAPPK